MPQVAGTDTTHGEPGRLVCLDTLRGLLMALMALDHASQFIAQRHSSGEFWGGPFPVYADALAFLTRAVTHLCAPGFFFLMGAGMVLLAHSEGLLGSKASTAVRNSDPPHRGRRRRMRDLIRHFWLRGSLFIALEFLVVSRGWELSPGGWGLRLYAGVLFALGSCMILGSLLLRLRPGLLLALGATLAVATELLTPAPSHWLGTYPALTRLLLIPGGDRALFVHYPVLPWLGLACFGMAFGHWLARNRTQAFGRMLPLGAACLLCFLLLRTLNGFGNIRTWSGGTWIDFLNVVKYPPSVAFQALTLGVDLLLLWGLAHVRNRTALVLRPLTVLGGVPLFFYVTHLYVYALLGRWLTPRGASITGMYPYWLLGLFILYPLCLWYGQLKRRQPHDPVLRLL